MSGERNIGNTGQIDKIKDRLHSFSLFSKSDFTSPADILYKSNILVKNMSKTLRGSGGFANDIFSDYASTNDPKKIKYNDLISAIFAIYKDENINHHYQKGSYIVGDLVTQTEIEDVVDTLNGSNTDFISGKKNFLITKKVLPAYLIIRSFKEIDNKWFYNILSGFSGEQKQELKDIIIDLKKNLLHGIDSPEAKLVIATQFEQSLKTFQVRKAEKTKITILAKKIVKYELKQKANKVKYFLPEIILQNAESQPQMPETTENSTLNFDDSLLYEGQVNSPYFVPKNIFKIDLKKGTFDLSYKTVGSMLELAKDEGFKKILKTFPESEDLAGFFALHSLSTNKDYAHFALPTEKDLPVIKAFTKVFYEMTNNRGVSYNLYKLFTKSIKVDDNGSFNMVSLNRELTALLYKSAIGPYTASGLVDFLETSYAKKAVLSLKKLFFTQLANSENIVDERQFIISYISKNGIYKLRHQRLRRAKKHDSLE